MALSCIIKEVKRDIGRTFFNFFSYPLAFDAHVRGGANCCHAVWYTEKLEWCGYLMFDVM